MTKFLSLSQSKSAYSLPPPIEKNYILLQNQNHLCGNARDSYQKLPPMNWTYGKKSTIANYGTNEQIGGWKYSRDSPEPKRKANFVALNREGIVKHISDPKDFSEMKKSNPILEPKKNSIGNYCRRINSLSQDFQGERFQNNFRGFGKQSNISDLPFKGLVQNEYGRKAEQMIHKNKLESKIMHQAICDYEKKLMQGRSTQSYKLLKTYKVKIEQLKTEESQPRILYRSKLFPHPTKSSIDNKMDMSVYSKTKEAKEQRQTLNNFLNNTRSSNMIQKTPYL